jgi:hypothetical protein
MMWGCHIYLLQFLFIKKQSYLFLNRDEQYLKIIVIGGVDTFLFYYEEMGLLHPSMTKFYVI